MGYSKSLQWRGDKSVRVTIGSDRLVGWLDGGGITVARGGEAERRILAQRVRGREVQYRGRNSVGEQRAGVGGLSRRGPPGA